VSIQLELDGTTTALVCDVCGHAYYRSADADDDTLRDRAANLQQPWHSDGYGSDVCHPCWLQIQQGQTR